MNEQIKSTISALREQYLEDDKAASFQEINNGLCDDFAHDTVCALKAQGNDNVHDISIALFQVVDDDNYDNGRPFAKKLLKKHWPEVKPPNGFTWKEMDQFSIDVKKPKIKYH